MEEHIKVNASLQKKADSLINFSFFLDKRSWVKTLTWRILATSVTILLLSIFGLKFEAATSIGLTLNLSKTLLYYLHERLWEAREARLQ
jgi:uncharacterized membrane protein